MDRPRSFARILRALPGPPAALLAILAVAGAPPPPASSQSADPEVGVWAETRAADTPEAYQRYLDTHPFGVHAEEAFERLITGVLGSHGIESIEPAEGGRPAVEVTPLGDLY